MVDIFDVLSVLFGTLGGQLSKFVRVVVHELFHVTLIFVFGGVQELAKLLHRRGKRSDSVRAAVREPDGSGGFVATQES